MSKKINLNRRQILGVLSLGSMSFLHGNARASPMMRNGHIETENLSLWSVATLDSFMEMKDSKQLKTGMLVHTLGYYSAGDGGEATYKLYPVVENEVMQIGEWKLENGFVAKLVGVRTVNYAMFGAKGDGANDDGDQIKQAHDYANLHKLPVANMVGEYWLKASQTIYICTHVEWGTTIFHISESKNTRNNPRFVIRSYQEPREIDWNNETKKKFLEKLKPGIQQFEELTPYKNTLVIVRDDNDRIGYRAGYSGTSWAREDFFYVEEHGRILGDIAWTFEDYTHLIAYPAEESYLVVDGGMFYISGEGPEQDTKKYRHNGFTITRSRTIIRNQWVGMEKGAIDISLSPRTGFYNFSCVYDITLENIRLIPWEQDREGKERDVPAGTYGISGARVLKSYFNNVMAEGGVVHWGVFGTNLMKDLCVDRCHFNRIDVHFHAWNVHIKDSKIGYRGITVSGGGQLTLENTSSSCSFFVMFRRDYGSTWNGHIRISNCKFMPPISQRQAVMYFYPGDFEHGYPTGMAHSIHVENLLVELPSDPSSSSCWVVYAPTFSTTKTGRRLFFPDHITLRNIRVIGGRSGVRIIKLVNPEGFVVKSGLQNNGRPNSQLLLEDIDLEMVDYAGDHLDAHIHFISDGKSSPKESLYPQLYIVRCNGLVASFDTIRADIDVKHSLIYQFLCSPEKKLIGKVTFWDCTFEPLTVQKVAFNLESDEGTSLINCRLSAPLVNGKPALQEMDEVMGFVKMNKTVKYNHLNTMFDSRTRQAIKEKGIKLKKEFMKKLMQNSEFDDEQ